MSQIIQSLSDLSGQYDAVLCDVWGVYHNGRSVFPDAIKALAAFRAEGGTVLLLTNAPRPQASVVKQLDRLGAPRDSYDGVVTSGDSAQTAMISGMFGKRVYHLGPAEKDAGFFIAEDGSPVDIERVSLKDAEGIVCTGLFDDTSETRRFGRGLYRGRRAQFLFRQTASADLQPCTPKTDGHERRDRPGRANFVHWGWHKDGCARRLW